MDEQVSRIANRVRRWRDESGLTLQELARRSGVAASTIQKVETLQMVPSIAVLLKIARGLGRGPSELVKDETGEAELVHQRASDRTRIGNPDKMTVERLVGDLVVPNLEVWRVVHMPGCGIGKDPIRFDGEELLICEKGELEVTVDEVSYVLKPGDTLHFKANVRHGWRNPGAKPVQFLVVGTLPRALRALLPAG